MVMGTTTREEADTWVVEEEEIGSMIETEIEEDLLRQEETVTKEEVEEAGIKGEIQVTVEDLLEMITE